MDVPDELRRWIGRESEPVRAPGPIEWGDVRRYVNATGDMNPLWGAADLKQNPARTGALAPPAMILDVLRPGAGRDEVDETGRRAFPSPTGLAAIISIPGEIARLNAGTEIQWMRPLRIGDWVTVRFKILDVEWKATASGPTIVITEQRTYSDQDDETLAVVRQVILCRVAGPTAPGGTGNASGDRVNRAGSAR